LRRADSWVSGPELHGSATRRRRHRSGNATLGLLLKSLTLPLTIVTFGLFLLVINAIMFTLRRLFVPGFMVNGFFLAFFGAIVLRACHMALRTIVFQT